MTIRNLVFASLMGLTAVTGGACAADPGQGPWMVNRNGEQEVAYGPRGPGNVAGGAYATVTGGGDNMTYTAAATGAHAQAGTGQVATLLGGGDNLQVVYVPAAPSATMLAGRR